MATRQPRQRQSSPEDEASSLVRRPKTSNSMVNVTARKIRDHGRERSGIGLGRVYHGFLVSYPVVGRGMVIFRDPNGHRMITTAVRRMLKDPDSDAVYVETENSVYRLTFHAEVGLDAVA